MNTQSIIDFVSRAPFSTLLCWHRAKPHLSMLKAMERTYGAREARVWLAGRVLLDEEIEFRTTHFQPDPNVSIPQDTD